MNIITVRVLLVSCLQLLIHSMYRYCPLMVFIVVIDFLEISAYVVYLFACFRLGTNDTSRDLPIASWPLFGAFIRGTMIDGRDQSSSLYWPHVNPRD